jgi:serine/threonine-protein kinase
MLLPATGEELGQAAALAQRAVAVREGDKWGHPYFEFVHGLAEYRQGQFDQAITTMRGDGGKVLGPCPKLVIAMALHQNGKADEARKILASAVLSYNWTANQVRDNQDCVAHSLRREAESMILPNLPAFMAGKYKPQDNHERLALLGACQFMNRTRAMARLYADAFAAAPSLADDLSAGHRYNAARAAALAGRGHGADATGLGEEERARWREQARKWLRADLAARARDVGSTATRGANRMALTRWRHEPDLAGLREPGELDKLSADERKECLALWAEVVAVLTRTQQ